MRGPIFIVTVLAVQTICGALSPTSANEAHPADQTAAPTPALRRVFVPADHPEQWPTGDQRFIPYDSARFDDLIDNWRKRSGAQTSPPALIERAEVRIELDASQRLSGEVRCQVRLPGDRPRLLPLKVPGPLGVDARWAGQAEPAELGWWTGPNVGAFHGLLVRKSGELRLRWEAAGEPIGESFTYELDLPEAVQQTMTVVAPIEVRVDVNAATLQGRKTNADEDMAAWEFLLAPVAERRLTTSPQDSHNDDSNVRMRYGREENYRLLPHGIEYEATCKVRPASPSFDRERAETTLSLDASDQLRILSIDVDGQPRRWIRDAATGYVQILLPAADRATSIHIRGGSELPLDRPWRLPSIALRGATWTEGSAHLDVGPQLKLLGLDPSDARLTNVVGVGRQSTGEAYRLQYWKEESGATVKVGKIDARLRAAALTTATLDEGLDAVETTLRLQAEHAAVYRFVANVGANWKVESVESEPPGEVADWHLDSPVAASTAANGRAGDRLAIRLRRAPSSGAPVLVRVSGRLDDDVRQLPIPVSRFRWLTLPDAPLQSHMLALSHRNLATRITGASAALVNLTRGEERDLYGQFATDPPAHPPVLIDLENEARGVVAVERRRPVFNAQTVVNCTAAEDQLSYEVRLTCRPSAGQLSDLTVVFSKPLPNSARWLLPEGSRPLAATPLGNPVADSLASERAIADYRVLLPEPTDEPVEIVVTYRRMRTDKQSIDCATVPEASSWNGWAIVRGDPQRIQIDPQACAPAPSPTRTGVSGDGAEPGSPVLGAFRIDSRQPLHAEQVPQVIRRRIAPLERPGVACRFVEAASTHAADGSMVCQSVYHLESIVEKKLRFEFDRPATGLKCWIDGSPAVADSRIDETRSFQVTVPADKTSCAIALEYRMHGDDLLSAGRLATPWPRPSFEVLEGEWTVWTPPQFSVWVDGTTHTSVVERLTGRVMHPATRPAGSRPRAKSRGGLPTGELKMSGWRSASFYFIGEMPAPIIDVAVRRRTVWIALCMLTAVAAVWLGASRIDRLCLAIGFACVVCLIAPERWLNAAQAAAVGLVLGAILSAARVLLHRWRPAAPHSTLLRAGGAAVALLLAASLLTAAAVGQSAATQAPPSVLFPVDQTGARVGDDIFLSPEFLHELKSAASFNATGGAEAVVTSSRCRLRLAEDSESTLRGERNEANPAVPLETAARTPSVLSLYGKSYRANAVLQLPLRAGDAVWLDEQHKVDGAPARVKWVGADSCEVELPRPGAFELRLSFYPQVIRDGQRHAVRLHVPPLPRATLALDGAEQLQDLTIAGRAIPVANARQTSIAADLGGAPLVEVAWRQPTKARQELRVEQLQWLKIQPYASRLEVKMRLAGDGPAPEILRLSLTPDLSVLPPEDDSPVQSVTTETVGSSQIQVKLPAGGRLPMEIPFAFQLKRTASIGQIEFPQVRVLGVEASRRWLATTVADDLIFNHTPGEQLRSLPVDEFRQLWGIADQLPAVAYAADDEDVGLTVEVRPRTPHRVADHELVMTCYPQKSLLEYAARIQTGDAPVVVHRIVAPASLKQVEARVRSIETGAELPVRWSRSAANQITIWLGAPQRSGHELMLSGEMPAPRASTRPIPRLHLVDAELNPLHLELRRRRETVVAWQGAAPPEAAGLPTKPFGNSAFVGAYAIADPSEATYEISVAENSLAWRARTVTLVSIEPKQTAELLLQSEVVDGILDHFTIRTSKGWTGPFTVTPEGRAVARPGPPDAEQALVDVFLGRPLRANESQIIRVHGHLAVTPDRRVRVPELRVLGLNSLGRYVSLPSMVDDPIWKWGWDGLRGELLPGELAAAAAAGKPRERRNTFRIVGNRFSAQQRIGPKSLRSVRVRSVEVDAAIDAQGAAIATARFILQPGGTQSCTLELSDGAEILRLSSGGLAIHPTRRGQQRFEIPFAPPAMPVQIVARYRQQIASSGPQMTLATPRLLINGLVVPSPPVRWSLTPSEGLQAEAAPPATRISPAKFDAVGVREKVEAVEEASLLALQLPIWEARQWYRQWRPQIPAPQRSGAENLAPAASPSAAASQASPQQIPGSERELLEKLVGDGALGRTSADSVPRHPSGEHRRDCYVTEGPVLILQTAHGQPVWPRWLLACAAATLLVVVARRSAPQRLSLGE